MFTVGLWRSTRLSRTNGMKRWLIFLQHGLLEFFVIVSQLEIKATSSVTPDGYPNHWATRTHVSNFFKQPSLTSFNAIPSFIFNYCIGRLECLPFAILQGIMPLRYNSYWKNVLQSIFYFTWSGACNSTIFLSRRFHKLIYFWIESTLNETPAGVP